MIQKKNSLFVDRSIQTPWGPIGYVTFKRTYARRLNDDDPNSPTEEFPDVVERELDACERQLKLDFTDEEKRRYAETRLGLKWSVAGRFMWQLGTKTVEKLGLPSLQNCGYITIDSPVEPFVWIFDMLMLGAGVGFNIQREYVYSLPKLKGKIKIERMDTNDADFIVPDTREGWVKLLSKVLKAHFYGGKGFTYSTVCVRGRGAPIKGFGGVASGPEELCSGISEIHKILNSRAKKKLRPIDCLDVVNIIASIVVAGNIRRSATIALGDFDDLEYLKAKRWDLGPIPSWRDMSNNSIVVPKNMKDLPAEFWQTYEQGEPYGLINLDLSRSCGRLGDTRYKDENVAGFNPCGEQSLESGEQCCLSELFLPNISNYEEFIEVISYAYRVCKHSLRLPCHLKQTEAVVHKNMRMGIGVTGIMECSEEQLSWLPKAYEWLRAYDEEYSKKNGWPISIKLTTLKPSGTLSLLKGVTPGVHPSPAGPYYIRRIQIAGNSPLIPVLQKHGIHIEPRLKIDGSVDKTTFVSSFPCKVAESVPVAANMHWKDQLEMVKRLQTDWSDNSVSCTVYYKKEDLPELRKYIEENMPANFKTLSFLLYSGHGFKQAPYETISREQYDEMMKTFIPINSIEDSNGDDFKVDECAGGSCPIK